MFVGLINCVPIWERHSAKTKHSVQRDVDRRSLKTRNLGRNHHDQPINHPKHLTHDNISNTFNRRFICHRRGAWVVGLYASFQDSED